MTCYLEIRPKRSKALNHRHQPRVKQLQEVVVDSSNVEAVKEVGLNTVAEVSRQTEAKAT